MNTPGGPEEISGARVTPSWFDVYATRPALGRAFTPTENAPGAPDVVVLSDAFWRRSFGADRAVIGRTVTLDDRPRVIIGVMPANGAELEGEQATALWTPRDGSTFRCQRRVPSHMRRLSVDDHPTQPCRVHAG